MADEGGFRLRPATASDARLLWKWRNDPSTRRWCFDTEEVPWHTHQEWLAARLADQNALLYIGEDVSGEPVGVARFSLRGSEAEIHVIVSPDARGRGIGSALISLACTRLFSAREAIQCITARTAAGNQASMRAFQKARFELTGPVGPCAAQGTSWVLRREAPSPLEPRPEK